MGRCLWVPLVHILSQKIEPHRACPKRVNRCLQKVAGSETSVTLHQESPSGTVSRCRVGAFKLERQNRCRFFFDILPALEKGEDCKLGLSE